MIQGHVSWTAKPVLMSMKIQKHLAEIVSILWSRFPVCKGKQWLYQEFPVGGLVVEL